MMLSSSSDSESFSAGGCWLTGSSPSLSLLSASFTKSWKSPVLLGEISSTGGSSTSESSTTFSSGAGSSSGSGAALRDKELLDSARKAATAFRRKRLGMSDPGDVPFSLQSGHSFSSDSSRAVRTHSSQKELPQHGIMTASLKMPLQMEQIKSSGISRFSSTNWFLVGS